MTTPTKKKIPRISRHVAARQVLSSDVGAVNEARLQLLFSVVAFLLQTEINGSVLK